MNRCSTYTLVAAMAISGMSLYAADNTAPFNNGNTGAGAQMQQTGGQMADEAASKAVRNELARLINASVEANNFSKVPTYLAKADKDRLSDSKTNSNDALNNTINQFRNDFKSKYNQEFDISGDHLRNAMVYAGQDKNSATVAIARPMGNAQGASAMPGNATDMNSTTPNTGATADRTLNTTGTDRTVSNRSGDMSGAGVTSATNGNRTGPSSNGENSSSTVRGNDTTATPGMVTTDHPVANGATNGTNTAVNTNTDMANSNMNNAASANLNTMAAAGMSGTTLNLVNEGHVMNAWRISAPQLSAEQLKQNLTKHIQMLDDQKAAWPSDVNQAYQAAAYHVLSAFSDNAVATER